MQRKDPQNINLNLDDIDGCLFHQYGDPSDIHKWLITTNQKYFDLKIKDIQQNNYDLVIFGPGTNRQDKEIDTINSFRGGSAVPVLPILQSYYAQALDNADLVVLDPFWMADIYGGKEAGASYFSVLRERYKKTFLETHSQWVFDHSKISIIYAHAHRVASLFPHAKNITIDMTDDLLRKLEPIHQFYKKFPQLLPKNVKLKLHHYDGDVESYELNPQFEETIQGTGEVDANYEWSVRYLAFMMKNKKASSAENLKQYHDANQYTQDDEENAINLSAKHFNVEEFLTFRDNHIPALAPYNTIGTQSHYTTAAELRKTRLIPKRFFIKPTQPANTQTIAQLLSEEENKDLTSPQIPPEPENTAVTCIEQDTTINIEAPAKSIEPIVTEAPKNFVSPERIQSRVESNALANQQRVCQSYLRKQISITQLINFLTCYPCDPIETFDAFSTLKNIANNICWLNQGFKFFSWKTPNGIDEIKHAKNKNLEDLALIAEKRLSNKKSSVFRTQMTDEFYHLIIGCNLIGVDNQVRQVTMNCFCEKWNINELTLQYGSNLSRNSLTPRAIK